MNKYKIIPNGVTDSQLVIPITLDWDYYGVDQNIDVFQQEATKKIIGKPYDFEVDRFANEPYDKTPFNTDIRYNFYFYSGGSLSLESNWVPDYRMEGFTAKEIFYYSNSFSNSFFKLDLYDSPDNRKQTNYVTMILPTQQGLVMEALVLKTLSNIKKPEFVLDYVGDKEGFFIYWLKKRNFLDINTFYMTAKFYNAKTGQFVKMMNMPQSSIVGSPYTFDEQLYFYYRVDLSYENKSYKVFNINPYQTLYTPEGDRAGTPIPIKWYEYVNPPL